MFEVFGFYKFIKIRSLKKNKVLLQNSLISKKIRGTIIIANEGLNGTISGNAKDITSTINKLKKYFLLKNLITAITLKVSFNHFTNLKWKLKKK